MNDSTSQVYVYHLGKFFFTFYFFHISGDGKILFVSIWSLCAYIHISVGMHMCLGCWSSLSCSRQTFLDADTRLFGPFSHPVGVLLLHKLWYHTQFLRGFLELELRSSLLAKEMLFYQVSHLFSFTRATFFVCLFVCFTRQSFSGYPKPCFVFVDQVNSQRSAFLCLPSAEILMCVTTFGS